jgi:hypothetical protein
MRPSSRRKGYMNTFKFVMALVLSALVVCFATYKNVAYAASGAIWTTNVNCGGVNVNIFTNVGDVYLNGGPNGNGGNSGLDDGDYYVKVTTPGGDLLSDIPTITVSNGNFAQCYNLHALTHFGNTTNQGGEYKVWISSVPDFAGGNNKTDNFKVGAAAATPTATPGSTSTPAPTAGITSIGRASSMGTTRTACIDNKFDAYMDLTDNGSPVSGVNVKFTYRGSVKTATSNAQGHAQVQYNYDGLDAVTGEPDGFPSQSNNAIPKPDNCPATQNSTPAASPAGQVLGASVLAGTGTFDEIIMNGVGMFGLISTIAGVIMKKKSL